MAIGRGRGKFNISDIKKDDKTLAGPKVSSPSNESVMDDYLKKLQKFRKPVAKDGSCLFRVVSEQIYDTQAKHPLVRHECIEYMRENKELFESFIEGPFDHHLYLLQNPKEWGGQVEISALSHLYKRDFIVYQNVNVPPHHVTCNGYTKKIYLCYLNGNHYDSVYPVSFKENAAMTQSILYDLLLDNVFPEIGRREEQKLNVSPKEESFSGWTEVKTKQRVKTADDISERINAALPNAAKDSTIFWEIKRSLDPNHYRNIEHEIWNENRSLQVKYDHASAIKYQFKPGDLCLATIKESKDVSETIRVKVQEINPDKCRVLSEDCKHQYYVQLNDLKPITNGDNKESFKTLSGYYNKSESDSDFQSQRKRGKNRRTREDEQRKHDSNNFSRSNDLKRHEHRSEKESRNNRRVRKESERKKESENDNKDAKVSAKASELKDNEELEEPAKNTGTNETVAKPEESAAAFWGRFRSKPNLTTNQLNPIANDFQPNVGQSIKVSAAFEASKNTIGDTASNNTNVRDTENKAVQEQHDIQTSKENSEPALSPINLKGSPYSHTFPLQTVSVSTTPATVASKNLQLNDDSITFSNSSTTDKPNQNVTSSVASSNSEKIPFSSVNNSSSVSSKMKHTDKTAETSVWNSLPSSTSVGVLFTPAKTTNTVESPSNSSTLETPSSSFLSIAPLARERTPSPVIDTQKFNLSIQASMKVSEVHENILATSAKMSAEMSLAGARYNRSASGKNTNVTNCLEQINSELKSRSPNLAVTPLVHNNRDIDTDYLSQSGNLAEDLISNDLVSNPIKDVPAKGNDTSDNVSIENSKLSQIKDNDSVEKTGNLKKSKSEVKKKVSFNLTTAIHENPDQLYSHAPAINSNLLLSHSEPGKIVLPPDHREKVLTDYAPALVNTHEMHQSSEHTPLFISQPQAFMTYYPPISNYPVAPLIHMFPTAAEQVQLPVGQSRDPEGKDLPEDINVLRHYYNLGVQFHMMTIQNQLNQNGLLPFPVHHPHIVRPVLMATDQNTSVRSSEVYSPTNIQNNSEQIMEIQHSNIIQTNRMQPFNVQMQTQGQYEEYELPPRLRRVPQNRGGNRNFHQRQPFSNGRGIMGQAPGPRSDFIRTNNHPNYKN